MKLTAIIEGKNIKISIHVPQSMFSFLSNVVGCTRNSTVQGPCKVKINELAHGIQACWSIKERQALRVFTQQQQHYHTATQLFYRIISLARKLTCFIQLQVVQITTFIIEYIILKYITLFFKGLLVNSLA